MHNRPVARMAGQLEDVCAGQNETYGGSRDTDVTDWQANPTGRSPSCPVMTATPVQKWPSTALILAGFGAPSLVVVMLGSVRACTELPQHGVPASGE